MREVLPGVFGLMKRLQNGVYKLALDRTAQIVSVPAIPVVSLPLQLVQLCVKTMGAAAIAVVSVTLAGLVQTAQWNAQVEDLRLVTTMGCVLHLAVRVILTSMAMTALLRQYYSLSLLRL